MEMTTVSIQMDKDVKDKIDAYSQELGISFDHVANGFLRNVFYYDSGVAITPMNQNKTPEDAIAALRRAQEAFAGEAERQGLETLDDVVAFIKEIRRERWEEKYGKSLADNG